MPQADGPRASQGGPLRRLQGRLTLVAAIAAIATTAAACGARTRLRDGDDVAATDAGADARVAPARTFATLCAAASPKRVTAPAYLEIVLDGSGSMQSLDATTRGALGRLFVEARATADPSFGIGLTGFSDEDDPTGGAGPYPTATDVGVAAVDDAQERALSSRLEEAIPKGSTPTYRALSGAYEYMHDLPLGALPPGGNKVLVLVTDGSPNGALVEKESCRKLASLEGALAAPTGPVRLFVVGIGPTASSHDYDPVFLSELAVAGGTAAAGCAPSSGACHYQITPPPEGQPPPEPSADPLLVALERIRGLVSGACDFTLNGDPTAIDGGAATVTWTDGAHQAHVVPKDDANGWHVSSAGGQVSLAIAGRACAAITADPRSVVDVSLPCGRPAR